MTSSTDSPQSSSRRLETGVSPTVARQNRAQFSEEQTEVYLLKTDRSQNRGSQQQSPDQLEYETQKMVDLLSFSALLKCSNARAK